VGIEAGVHLLARIAAKIAKVVYVYETVVGEDSACREAKQFAHLFRGAGGDPVP
jgi:hypothetical protein